MPETEVLCLSTIDIISIGFEQAHSKYLKLNYSN